MGELPTELHDTRRKLHILRKKQQEKWLVNRDGSPCSEGKERFFFVEKT